MGVLSSISALSSPPNVGVREGVTVEIGGIPIFLRSGNAEFCRMIEDRYAGFVNPFASAEYEFEIDLNPPSEPSDEDARVSKQGNLWFFDRGDFHAEWDSRTRRGWVRQAPNPYAIDTVLRIVHSLVLAEEGGFLLHAASAVRSGQSFVFSGISGAGKTTISRLAPADVAVLTDEISYIRRRANGYRAYGTPFAGELARVGENISAPFGGLYFLEKGPVNSLEPIDDRRAARALLRNILFFSHDEQLVTRVFDSAFEFVSRVATARLIFTPDERAWGLVG
ncbi:MAG TPA: hypothetical protein VHX49_13740 [Candidatus Acidoferrales bacterium]|jgi:hypothetical protein|nr:hypothetical protein [Candidatus Acidoferrales bacterium]